MDVQQIVLQAQRSALDVSIDNNDNELVERNENGASLLSNARLTNGFGEQMVQQNSHMDESVVCRKGGDDEVEWEECQIKVVQCYMQIYPTLIISHGLERTSGRGRRGRSLRG